MVEYVEILISFWNGLFSGAILVYQSVVICPDLGIIDFVGLSQDALVLPTKDEEIIIFYWPCGSQIPAARDMLFK